MNNKAARGISPILRKKIKEAHGLPEAKKLLQGLKAGDKKIIPKKPKKFLGRPD
jgi:hypothetical protein